MRQHWLRLFEGEDATRVMTRVFALAADLEQHARAHENDDEIAPSTWAELAMLYAYLACATQEDRFRELSRRCGEQAGDRLARVALRPALLGGFVEVAWVEHHLGKISGGEQSSTDEADELFEEIDTQILEQLSVSPWLGNYDLINGLVGLGVYFLDRLPSARAREGLVAVVRRLSEMAQESAAGVCWHTPARLLLEFARSVYPNGRYDLGLAHGVPGVLAFLADAHASGIVQTTVEPLLEGGVRWLLAQELRPGSDACLFPSMAGDPTAGPSRLAWCYGDLGLSASVLKAGLLLGRRDWEQEALRILGHAATIRREASFVADAGFCHGAVGVAHLFNRAFQATKQAELGVAARRWYEVALAMARPGVGFGGYQSLMPESYDAPSGTVWRDNASLLEGAVGVGLSLLAAATEIEPAWDHLLLTSL